MSARFKAVVRVYFMNPTSLVEGQEAYQKAWDAFQMVIENHGGNADIHTEEIEGK